MCSAHKAFNNRVSQHKLCEKVGRALQSLKAIHDAAGKQLPLARLHYLDAKVQRTHFAQQPWPFTQAYEVHAEECFTWHLSWGTRRADDKRPPTETTSWSMHHEELWQWVPATVTTQERPLRDDFDVNLVKMARLVPASLAAQARSGGIMLKRVRADLLRHDTLGSITSPLWFT